MNCELPGDQAGFRKGRGTRDQLANIHWMAPAPVRRRDTRPVGAIGPGDQIAAEGPSEGHSMIVILDSSHFRGFSPRDYGAAKKLTFGY